MLLDDTTTPLFTLTPITYTEALSTDVIAPTSDHSTTHYDPSSTEIMTTDLSIATTDESTTQHGTSIIEASTSDSLPSSTETMTTDIAITTTLSIATTDQSTTQHDTTIIEASTTNSLLSTEEIADTTTDLSITTEETTTLRDSSTVTEISTHTEPSTHTAGTSTTASTEPMTPTIGMSTAKSDFSVDDAALYVEIFAPIAAVVLAIVITLAVRFALRWRRQALHQMGLDDIEMDNIFSDTDTTNVSPPPTSPSSSDASPRQGSGEHETSPARSLVIHETFGPELSVSPDTDSDRTITPTSSSVQPATVIRRPINPEPKPIDTTDDSVPSFDNVHTSTPENVARRLSFDEVPLASGPSEMPDLSLISQRSSTTGQSEPPQLSDDDDDGEHVVFEQTHKLRSGKIYK